MTKIFSGDTFLPHPVRSKCQETSSIFGTAAGIDILATFTFYLYHRCSHGNETQSRDIVTMVLSTSSLPTSPEDNKASCVAGLKSWHSPTQTRKSTKFFLSYF